MFKLLTACAAAALFASASEAVVTYNFLVAPILGTNGQPLSTVDGRTFTFQISGPANYTLLGTPEYRAYSYSYTEFGSTIPVIVPATLGKNIRFDSQITSQGGLGLTNSGNRNFAIYNTALYDEAAFRADPAAEPIFTLGTYLLSTTPWNNPVVRPVPRPEDNYTVTISAGAVPEPATWAMLVGGFGLMGGVVRRSRVVARFA